MIEKLVTLGDQTKDSQFIIINDKICVSLCFAVNMLKQSMVEVQQYLFVMDTRRPLKNHSRKFLLETLKISLFKSIYTEVTVTQGFNLEFYSRDSSQVSFILTVDVSTVSFCVLSHTFIRHYHHYHHSRNVCCQR